MSEKDDGGPAFPCGEHGAHLGGMTLRDYFAAKAMQGLMGRSWDHLGNDVEKIDAWATGAYTVADAMLKARKS